VKVTDALYEGFASGIVDGAVKAKAPDTEAEPPLRVEEASVWP
jgi:hypothetical protein